MRNNFALLNETTASRRKDRQETIISRFTTPLCFMVANFRHVISYLVIEQGKARRGSNLQPSTKRRQLPITKNHKWKDNLFSLSSFPLPPSNPSLHTVDDLYLEIFLPCLFWMLKNEEKRKEWKKSHFSRAQDPGQIIWWAFFSPPCWRLSFNVLSKPFCWKKNEQSNTITDFSSSSYNKWWNFLI